MSPPPRVFPYLSPCRLVGTPPQLSARQHTPLDHLPRCTVTTVELRMPCGLWSSHLVFTPPVPSTESVLEIRMFASDPCTSLLCNTEADLYKRRILGSLADWLPPRFAKREALGGEREGQGVSLLLSLLAAVPLTMVVSRPSLHLLQDNLHLHSSNSCQVSHSSGLW